MRACVMRVCVLCVRACIIGTRGPWWRVMVHMSDAVGVCMLFVFGFIVFPKTISRIHVSILSQQSPTDVRASAPPPLHHQHAWGCRCGE